MGRSIEPLNIYGEPLQSCRDLRDLPKDENGSWNTSGQCAGDGIHSVCVQSLPQSFCDKTKQNNWCQDRVNRPHCICQGAYAAYVTHAPKNDIQLQCSAIHQDILRTLETQARKWRPGMRADVPKTVRHLYRQCVEEQRGEARQQGVDDLRTELCNMYKDLTGLSKDDRVWMAQNCPNKLWWFQNLWRARKATRERKRRRRGSGRRRRGGAWPPAARAFRGARRGVGGALF